MFKAKTCAHLLMELGYRSFYLVPAEVEYFTLLDMPQNVIKDLSRHHPPVIPSPITG